MSRAVIYSRFSSDMQREESIDAQIRACQYYAQKFDLEVVGVYSDRAKSGKTARGRTEFLRMISDSEKGLFDVVLVHKLNRFARNSLDLLEYKKTLEAHHVELVSVTERLDNSPEGKLLLMVMSGINEFYSANLAQEVMKGLRENAYNGKTTGGVPPLGYDIGPDKRYVINEDEAQAVRIIFNMYAAGAGYGEIVAHLNSKGYRTKRGEAFGRNSLHDILKNEKYRGVFVFDKSTSKDAHGKRNGHREKPEFIRIPGGCPRIIDDELFGRVQRMMAHNRRSSASYKAKTVYLLSGKLYCGLCGHKMVGENRRANGTDYYYYVCNEAKRKKTCSKRVNGKEELEAMVIERLNEMAFSQERIDRIAQSMYNSYDREAEEVERIRREITQTDKEIKNLVAAIKKGLDLDEVMDELRKTKRYRAELESELLAVRSAPDSRASLDELKAYLRQFCDVKNLSAADQKALIQEYIEKIIVYDDETNNAARIEIVINPNGVIVDTMAAMRTLDNAKSCLRTAVLSKPADPLFTVNYITAFFESPPVQLSLLEKASRP